MNLNWKRCNWVEETLFSESFGFPNIIDDNKACSSISLPCARAAGTRVHVTDLGSCRANRARGLVASTHESQFWGPGSIPRRVGWFFLCMKSQSQRVNAWNSNFLLSQTFMAILKQRWWTCKWSCKYQIDFLCVSKNRDCLPFTFSPNWNM